MLEHLTHQQFEDYCRQQLRVAELLSVTDHLGECEACRRQLESGLNMDAPFFALRSQVFDEAADISSLPVRSHLTAEQTAGYVDGNLPGEELQIVADHLTNCDHCSLAIDDLRAFRNEIAPSLELEFHPSSPSQTQGWWRRMVAGIPHVFRVSPVPAFGAALAVLLFAATGWVIWQTVRDREPQQEIALTPSSSSETSASVDSASTRPTPTQAEEATPVLAQLNDGGGLLILDQEGKLSGADDLPPAYQNLLKQALTTGRVERSSQLRGLTRPPSSLMSSDKPGGEFSVIEPVGNVLISDRPTFRWSPMEGVTSYVVEVYDDQFQLVATSLHITSRSWVVPQSLSRGKVYAWQVKAIKDGQEVIAPRPPAPQAKFRILDQAKANELAKARRAYGSSHLALGLLYAEAGLLKESEQQLQMLLKANPESELARSLLRQVQVLRRRTQ